MPECFSHLATLEVRASLVSLLSLWWLCGISPDWFEHGHELPFLSSCCRLLYTSSSFVYSNEVGNTPESMSHFEGGSCRHRWLPYITLWKDICGCCTWQRGRVPGLNWEAILQEKVSQAVCSIFLRTVGLNLWVMTAEDQENTFTLGVIISRKISYEVATEIIF